jgi:hypothetical protein
MARKTKPHKARVGGAVDWNIEHVDLADRPLTARALRAEAIIAGRKPGFSPSPGSGSGRSNRWRFEDNPKAQLARLGEHNSTLVVDRLAEVIASIPARGTPAVRGTSSAKLSNRPMG